MSSHELFEYPLRTDFSAHIISAVVANSNFPASYNETWYCFPGFPAKTKKIALSPGNPAIVTKLDEKDLHWYNWLGISHFSQINMKHPIERVKWHWCNKKLTFIKE